MNIISTKTEKISIGVVNLSSSFSSLLLNYVIRQRLKLTKRFKNLKKKKEAKNTN